MTLTVVDQFAFENPIDSIEEIVSVNEWPFDRVSSEELSACINGSWCDHHLSFTYMEEREALQVIAAFDIRVKPERRAAVYELLGRINEYVWLGHFELWAEDSIPVYRHTQLMERAPELAAGQLESLIQAAVTECERFYPAFQFLLWSGKSAEEAIAACMLETVGEA